MSVNFIISTGEGQVKTYHDNQRSHLSHMTMYYIILYYVLYYVLYYWLF